jgi:hypothetical protein
VKLSGTIDSRPGNGQIALEKKEKAGKQHRLPVPYAIVFMIIK